ncbi:histidine kinase [Pelomonas sp. SE-A7]|uniref:sensor histidine kinase n=1 Tax=Pelomonas sp. SE-A7 TaxID=3054953 RepID=UPI00259CB774|nr:histidine kinase [Pelomonas sp. SE-A7]MDM4765077.1 histidine kinase [Pelomonas sp. SE-A7]
MRSPWRAQLRTAWRDFWRLKKHRQEPWWMGLLLNASVGALVGLSFVLLAALFSGNLLDTSFWRPSLVLSMQLGTVIALLSHAGLRLLEHLLSEERLQAINEGTGRASLLVFVGLPTLCSALGLVLIDTLLRWQRLGVPVAPRIPNVGTLITFLFCGALFSLLSFWRLRAQLKAQRTREQVTEAQLRLLQAQIEPHFLFNTLANVEGLIDYEPRQARQMLNAFTDYLRASLQQMRAQDVSLGQELDLVQSYLTVMQCRMGERLRTRTEVPEALLAARIPPLLLQPLIENALHHGLEPKVQGGLLQLRARPEGAGLVLEIVDDGVGLRHSHAHPRRGNGVALRNIRERLTAAYGPKAQLLLEEAAGGGTCVQLRLPALQPLRHPAPGPFVTT